MLEDEQLFERAALRWLARFLEDFPAVTLEQTAQAVEALQTMQVDAEAATGRLTGLCRAQPL